MTPLMNGISMIPPPGDMSCAKKDDIGYLVSCDGVCFYRLDMNQSI